MATLGVEVIVTAISAQELVSADCVTPLCVDTALKGSLHCRRHASIAELRALHGDVQNGLTALQAMDAGLPQPVEVPAPATSPARVPKARRSEPWTPAEIIAAIQKWAADHDGEPPTADEWEYADDDHPNYGIVRRRLGSFPEALKQAGFAPRPQGAQNGNQNRTGVKRPWSATGDALAGRPCKTEGCQNQSNTRYDRGIYNGLCEESCIPTRRIEAGRDAAEAHVRRKKGLLARGPGSRTPAVLAEREPKAPETLSSFPASPPPTTDTSLSAGESGTVSPIQAAGTAEDGSRSTNTDTSTLVPQTSTPVEPPSAEALTEPDQGRGESRSEATPVTAAESSGSVNAAELARIDADRERIDAHLASLAVVRPEEPVETVSNGNGGGLRARPDRELHPRRREGSSGSREAQSASRSA